VLLCCCAGDVWHVAVQGLPGSGVCYAVRVSGNGGWDTGYRWDKSRLLLDPRAPLVAGRKAWGKRDDFEEFQQEVCLSLQVMERCCKRRLFFPKRPELCARLDARPIEKG
jgi:hypothetical protein